MPNPYRTPRPNPIDPERFSDGGCIDDLFQADAMLEVLQGSFEWVCHEERPTRDIYLALFRWVDPERSRATEAMKYINEALYDLGFRAVGENPHPVNPTWKWVEVA